MIELFNLPHKCCNALLYTINVVDRDKRENIQILCGWLLERIQNDLID